MREAEAAKKRDEREAAKLQKATADELKEAEKTAKETHEKAMLAEVDYLKFKYTKASDEITAVEMSAKVCKDRYTNAINQVALRVPHEIFEADRRGLIGTISLEVGTQANDPATGLANFIPFVALAVSREEFMKLDLANVVPAATLAHLGASISKNPFELVPANTSGVRRT